MGVINSKFRSKSTQIKDIHGGRQIPWAIHTSKSELNKNTQKNASGNRVESQKCIDSSQEACNDLEERRHSPVDGSKWWEDSSSTSSDYTNENFRDDDEGPNAKYKVRKVYHDKNNKKSNKEYSEQNKDIITLDDEEADELIEKFSRRNLTEKDQRNPNTTLKDAKEQSKALNLPLPLPFGTERAKIFSRGRLMTTGIGPGSGTFLTEVESIESKPRRNVLSHNALPPGGRYADDQIQPTTNKLFVNETENFANCKQNKTQNVENFTELQLPGAVTLSDTDIDVTAARKKTACGTNSKSNVCASNQTDEKLIMDEMCRSGIINFKLRGSSRDREYQESNSRNSHQQSALISDEKDSSNLQSHPKNALSDNYFVKRGNSFLPRRLQPLSNEDN